MEGPKKLEDGIIWNIVTKNADQSIEDAGFKPRSCSSGHPINVQTSISIFEDRSDKHVKLVEFDKSTMSFTTVKDFGKAD